MSKVEIRIGQNTIHIDSLGITVKEHNFNVRIPKHDKIGPDGIKIGQKCRSQKGFAGLTATRSTERYVYGVKCNDCEMVWT